MFKFLKQRIINWCLSAETTTVGQFHQRLKSQYCTIYDDNNELKFIEQATNTDYLVQTPTGFSKIKQSLKTVPFKVFELILKNGKTLRCADTHIVINSYNEQRFVKDLKIGELIKIIDGSSAVVSIKELDEIENMYDLELDDDNHIFYTNGILSHNTVTVAIYILWLATFFDTQECVITSRSMSHATDIMTRVKFSYEELPSWLKAGCKFYNRTSIEFDNGSIIKSEATTEKTGRGGSPSIIFCDEIAFVSHRIQTELWASLAPSLSTGGKFILTTTPNGDTDLFATLWRGALSGINSFKPYMATYERHPERGEGSGYYEEMLAKLGETKTRAELKCEFVSSDALLISTKAIDNLKPVQPIFEDLGFSFWEPIGGKGKIYLVGIDIATGTGNDFSVINIFSFPELNQVAQWRSNQLNIPMLYSAIKYSLNLLTKPDKQGFRPEVFWSFERNGVGEAIKALLYNDDKPNEYAEIVNDKPTEIGMATTGKNKILSCLQLKQLLEKKTGGLKINSEQAIFELKNFSAQGGSYQAKAGATDDIVSSLLIIARVLKQVSMYDDRAQVALYDYNVSIENPEEADDSPIPFLIV